ncbi:MAG: NAD-dependent epimerase/dehydratase family protein, partial [Chloroflexota bacterium]
HTIDLAYADLMRDDGWHDAVQGCDYVLHLASPLPVVQPDNPNDLINPARDGALRIIKAARQGGVKRVVLTSSQAAVGGSRTKSPDYIYNENDWTDISDPTVSAYDQSKTIAERSARDYVTQHGDIELVTVNPGLVCGPILEPIFGVRQTPDER